MQQVIAFLGTGYLRYYNFSELQQFKKILLCGEYAKKNLSPAIAKEFDETHMVGVLPFEDKAVEIYELESLETVVADLLKDYPDLFLYCDDEKYLITAAQVREKFNLPGNKLADVLPYRNKVIMKELVKDLGCLRTPLYVSFDVVKLEQDASGYFAELAASFGLPFVVKPTELAGSYGVAIIHNAEDFTELAKTIDKRVDYEAEEYITGNLYHYDAVIDLNGKITFDDICQYVYPCAEALDGKILASILLDNADAAKPDILACGRELTTKLKAQGVVVHLELFKKEGTDELIFLEIAMRPGGYPCNGVYQDVYGFSIFNANLFVNLGIDYPINKQPTVKYYCAGNIPSRKGVVKKINTPLLKGRNELTYTIAVGDTLIKAFTLGHMVGRFKIFSDSVEDFKHDLDTVAKFNFFDLV